jgi:hypothetical protein
MFAAEEAEKFAGSITAEASLPTQWRTNLSGTKRRGAIVPQIAATITKMS